MHEQVIASELRTALAKRAEQNGYDPLHPDRNGFIAGCLYALLAQMALDTPGVMERLQRDELIEPRDCNGEPTLRIPEFLRRQAH